MSGYTTLDDPDLMAPTAIIWGAEDAYCLREEQLLLRDSIRHCRLVIYEDLGHSPHWEEPEHVTREILAFLKPRAFRTHR